MVTSDDAACDELSIELGSDGRRKRQLASANLGSRFRAVAPSFLSSST
jgi:hypothetical protein